MSQPKFAAAAAALAVTIGFAGVPARAQDAPDFTNILTLGDSITAGFESGSLFEQAQQNSYGNIFAQQVASPVFAQPLITDPGIPGQLYLKSLIPLSIDAKAGAGQPKIITYPKVYNNLGIPGARIKDIVATKTVCGFNPQDPTCANPFYDLILRNFVNPAAATTALQQSIGLAPTFAFVFAGNNDVLGAATNGAAIDNVTLTSVESFNTDLQTILGGLKQYTSAKMVLANIPDVTSLPFVSTIPRFVLDPITSQPVLDSTGQLIPLLGKEQGQETKPLRLGTRVTLPASKLIKSHCLGIPVGVSPTWDGYCASLGAANNFEGYPLPDGGIVNGAFQPGVLLYPEEITAIKTRTAEFNEKIEGAAAQLGVPVLDTNGIFRDIAANGLIYGGIEFNAAYLTGGMFSYDGIHPNNFGYAVLANEFVKVIDDFYGLKIPQVNLFPYMFGNSESLMAGSASAATMTDAAIDQIRRMFPPDLSSLKDGHSHHDAQESAKE